MVASHPAYDLPANFSGTSSVTATGTILGCGSANPARTAALYP